MIDKFMLHVHMQVLLNLLIFLNEWLGKVAKCGQLSRQVWLLGDTDVTVNGHANFSICPCILGRILPYRFTIMKFTIINMILFFHVIRSLMLIVTYDILLDLIHLGFHAL